MKALRWLFAICSLCAAVLALMLAGSVAAGHNLSRASQVLYVVAFGVVVGSDGARAIAKLRGGAS